MNNILKLLGIALGIVLIILFIVIFTVPSVKKSILGVSAEQGEEKTKKEPYLTV